jgi:CRISPR-associated endonuclease/helicase Cas3
MPDGRTNHIIESWQNNSMDNSHSNHSHIIAHRRSSDGKLQLLETHLEETAAIAASITAKIGLSEVGELLGLLHDVGKYSAKFQGYIQSATGMIDPDADYFSDFRTQKGKIDHSTAGAQWVWQRLGRYGDRGRFCAQILATCLASHHSGLIDCLKPEGEDGFKRRIDKPDQDTHLSECQSKAATDYLKHLERLADRPLLMAMLGKLQQLGAGKQHGQSISETIKHFYVGMFTRFLFSALIDADRINSADFEHPENQGLRNNAPIEWEVAINRTEAALNELPVRNRIDEIRRDISDRCRQRAEEPQGIYSLTVPTGGGKTYASLRYALHHAKTHKLDRIIYVIPYTSIIEQNAEAIRELIECGSDARPWVLEHHSNLEPEQQTWHSKLAAENWDAPIVLTTMVQFLEALFSGGTRGARRMHQLANSVIVFDEIQTLPVNCTHLFCNAINFLTTYTRTTALLCTATQPLLNQLRTPEKGGLSIPPENELAGDLSQLFAELKRVDISNRVRDKGWSAEEIRDLILEQFSEQGNCLVIVNTKGWAKRLYQLCREQISDTDTLFHLSTHQCPAHRKELLGKIRKRLDDDKPVVCISTQLMEAGVDVDFASVIRFLAGLDSVAQSAGRCNRNGRLKSATVHVINPADEPINRMADIKEGRDQALRIFNEFSNDELLTPPVMSQYFYYYFFSRDKVMSYPLTSRQAGQQESLLNLLADNKNNSMGGRLIRLNQSFMTVGKAFKAIDAPTEAIIVPYGEGELLIAALCGVSIEYDPREYYRLLKAAQKYSVNLFPNVLQKLREQEAIHEIQPGEGIFYLDERYYSEAFGVATEEVAVLGFLNV